MPLEIPPVSPEALRAAMPQPPGDQLSARIRKARESGDDATLRGASREFEALLMHRLIAEMRKSVPKSELLGRSMASEWFEGMLDEAVAKSISQGPGVGLSDVIYEQLNRPPGVKHPSTLPPLAERKAMEPKETAREAVPARGPRPPAEAAPPATKGGTHEPEG